MGNHPSNNKHEFETIHQLHTKSLHLKCNKCDKDFVGFDSDQNGRLSVFAYEHNDLSWCRDYGCKGGKITQHGPLGWKKVPCKEEPSTGFSQRMIDTITTTLNLFA